jgi:phosphatidylserine/phosphatidylglycerophosphate/cardiolipin synthase-like enzyme
LGIPNYWGSWKGRIIRAIAIDRLFYEKEIFFASGLPQEEFNIALNELLTTHIVSKNRNGKFWVNSKELYREYQEFISEQKEILTQWFKEYMQKMNLPQSSHYYLEDRYLDDFSIQLISQANIEVLVANPFIERCHLSNALIDASEKKIPIILITRPHYDNDPYIKKKEEYHLELMEKGIALNYNNVVHAKIIIVDRSVAVISSMNLNSSSSGGGSWEAGIVTTEESIINEAVKSIHEKLNKR